MGICAEHINARLNFDHFDTPFVHRHSHIQSLFKLSEGNDRVTLESTKVNRPIMLTPRTWSSRSVGQPRDRDPRADMRSLIRKRTNGKRAVWNTCERVQKRLREAGCLKTRRTTERRLVIYIRLPYFRYK